MIFAGGYLRASDKDYDWLGPGTYFWEGDADRAAEWAAERVKAGRYTKAAVVGAIIELGNCLDLTIRSHLELLADAYRSLESGLTKAGESIPENKGSNRGGTVDNPLRYLDCAVIKHYQAANASGVLHNGPIARIAFSGG